MHLGELLHFRHILQALLQLQMKWIGYLEKHHGKT